MQDDKAGSRTTGWQPIETAPKDGTKVDLWVSYESDPPGRGDPERVPNAHWCGENNGWIIIIAHGDYAGDSQSVEFENWYPSGGWFKCIATHWMPLLSPPENVHGR